MFRTIGFRFSGTAVSPHKNIHLLRDIKISTSVLSTTIDYSDDIKAIFIKYGIKYE